CPAKYLVPAARGIGTKLPLALSWAKPKTSSTSDLYEDPNLIFADGVDDDRHLSVNDFLVRQRNGAPEEWESSRFLLVLMAHKRARLFGFALANRIVTIMLPHAILEPVSSGSSTPPEAPGSWLAQPSISFIRGGAGNGRFRRMYALTLFLLPVKPLGCSWAARLVTSAEIKAIVNPGWGFAAAPSPDRVARFE